jgi:UDP-GlcNAc:undecaprenyl-phosphate/decaprenyl-phosphate GlcNAc-1-phosphate transferase
MEYIYSLTVALFLTIALIPLLIRMSASLGLVDDPGAERKVHTTAMPRTGGLGIIIGVALPLLFLLPKEGYILNLFMGCGIIVLFGVLDDRFELSYKWKLFGQGLAVIVVMSGGLVIHQFPFFGLSDAPVWLSYPFTFLFLVGVVNGVNFSDGLDGLAAGTSIMALLLIFTLALQSGDAAVALFALTVVGGVLGFLRYNTFPANIFMGDAGSQFLGFVIACLAIAVTQSETSPYSVLLPILILGIPIMDILQVVPMRVHKKLPLPGPDKEHFHHQLGKLGFSHTEVVASIYVLQTVLMAGAYWLRYDSDIIVALFYGSFVSLVLGALLFGNAKNWQFRETSGQPSAESDRRNSYLRRFDWYFHNSARVIAVLLGVFYLAATWRLTEQDIGLWPMAVFFGVLVLSALISGFAYTKSLFRVVLYGASVLFAYWITESNLVLAQEYWLYGFMALLVVLLMLAIRMTRKQEFSLTTQDLLILLVVLLIPMLPGEMMGQIKVGEIALIVAVLMYASEYVLNRATRMAAFSVACSLAGISCILFFGN